QYINKNQHTACLKIEFLFLGISSPELGSSGDNLWAATDAGAVKRNVYDTHKDVAVLGVCKIAASFLFSFNSNAYEAAPPMWSIEIPHPLPSPQQPIDSYWVFLLSTSLEIYISFVYFSSFPLFFFLSTPHDLRRVDAIKQTWAARFRLRDSLLVFDDSREDGSALLGPVSVSHLSQGLRITDTLHYRQDNLSKSFPSNHGPNRPTTNSQNSIRLSGSSSLSSWARIASNASTILFVVSASSTAQFNLKNYLYNDTLPAKESCGSPQRVASADAYSYSVWFQTYIETGNRISGRWRESIITLLCKDLVETSDIKHELRETFHWSNAMMSMATFSVETSRESSLQSSCSESVRVLSDQLDIFMICNKYSDIGGKVSRMAPHWKCYCLPCQHEPNTDAMVNTERMRAEYELRHVVTRFAIHGSIIASAPISSSTRLATSRECNSNFFSTEADYVSGFILGNVFDVIPPRLGIIPWSASWSEGLPVGARSIVDRGPALGSCKVGYIVDECMMDHETDGDGAINLSTSQRPSAATTPNGNIEYDDQDQPHNKSQVATCNEMGLPIPTRNRPLKSIPMSYTSSLTVRRLPTQFSQHSHLRILLLMISAIRNSESYLRE
ncbi:hypothetical protein L9F63_022314, partial [Diploptera punctata]